MAVRTTGTRYTHLTDVYKRIGRVPANRIRLNPPPGLATEADLLRLAEGDPKCLCELVDGILVEKAVGTSEAMVGGRLYIQLGNYIEANDLGIALPADGMLRILPGLVRLPDISYLSWRTLPQREMPDEPIAGLAPDLAVEVISRTNTPSEMRQKLKDYFLSGVREVWFIDPRDRSARLFSSPETSRTLSESDSLESADLLPGFSVRLAEIFKYYPSRPARGKRSSRKRR